MSSSNKVLVGLLFAGSMAAQIINGGAGGGSGSGTVTAVTGTAPVVITSTPTTTPNVTVNGLAGITGAVKANGSGPVTQAACSDLSNAAANCAGNAANATTGTSGAVVATDNGTTSVFTTTLTGNVTSFTPTTWQAGKLYTWEITEGGSGGFTISGVASTNGFPCIITGSGVITKVYGVWNGTAWDILGSTNTSGYGCMPVGTVPTAAPASGILSFIGSAGSTIPYYINPSTTFAAGSPTAGTGMLVLGTFGNSYIAPVPATGNVANLTQTICSGAQAMGTSAITSTSQAALTISCPGLLSTDRITLTSNVNIFGVTGYVPSTSGILTISAFPTTNTINIVVANNTSSTQTPGALTLNYGVYR